MSERMTMRDALGVGWEDAFLDEEIEVCGARSGAHWVCDEPYWMGEHTWHTALSQGGWQWCSCGNDHAWNAACP